MHSHDWLILCVYAKTLIFLGSWQQCVCLPISTFLLFSISLGSVRKETSLKIFNQTAACAGIPVFCVPILYWACWALETSFITSLTQKKSALIIILGNFCDIIFLKVSMPHYFFFSMLPSSEFLLFIQESSHPLLCVL